MKRFFLLLLLALPLSAAAQQGYLGLAPAHAGAAGWAMGDAFGVAARYGRTVPLDYFLPQVAGDSEVNALGLALGIRRSGDDSRFAWAAQPFSLGLSRSPWTARLDLLSYDRTGALETDARWLGLQVGPVLGAGEDGRRIQLRFPVGVALSTIKVGHFVFHELPRMALERSFGAEGSASAVLRVEMGAHSAVAVSGTARRHLAGPEPRLYMTRIAIEGSPAAALKYQLGLRAEWASLSGVRQRIVGPTLSFRYSPSLRGI